MGITAGLVDEHGGWIGHGAAGDGGALVRATEDPEDYPRIAEIDIYGETIFGRSDLPGFLDELARLIDETSRHNELQWLLDVRDLAQRSQAEGARLKFLGD
jgi:hypothetical protein